MDRVLQALADPTRRRILDILASRPLAAGEIASQIRNMSRPAVSQHLAVLREAGLVVQERQGRRLLYRLDPNPLRDFWMNWLSKYEVLWSDKLLALKRAVELGSSTGVEGKHEE